MSNSKGDTKKYTQYTQPKFENIGSAPGSEMWPGFLHLKWGCWECEYMAIVLSVHLRACLSELFEMHCLPQRNYISLSLQEFVSLTIVHRYLEKSNMVSVLTSQRPEAPKMDILTEVARPELFGQCHIEMWSYSRRCSVSFLGRFRLIRVFVKLEGIGSKEFSVGIGLFVRNSWVAKLSWWRPWSFYKAMLPDPLSWLLMNVDKAPIAASVSSSE